MRVDITAATTLQTIPVQGVSQVVVRTVSGDAAMVCYETPGGAVIAVHAGESDFARTCTDLGVALSGRPER